MKKYIAIFWAVIPMYSFAQNSDDIARYSNIQMNGNARSMGMGGVSTTLGADFSSMSTNPAGMGFYRTNQLSGGLSFNVNNTSSTYINNNINSGTFSAQLPQMGIVFTNEIPADKSGKASSFINFGFGYNTVNDFNRQLSYSGNNPSSSYLDRLAEYATQAQIDYANYNPDDFLYTEDMAIVANAIVPTSNTTYDANLPADAIMNQTGELNTTGRMNDWNANLSANISQRLFLGISVGVTTVRYRNKLNYSERLMNGDGRSFENYSEFYTRGSGFNAKLGAIYQPTDFLRFGVSYHSQTVYNLTDQINETFMTTNFPDDNYTNVNNYEFALGPYTSTYQIKTPQRFSFGATYLYKKMGLISVDYESIDYSQGSLGGIQDISSVNSSVRRNFQNTTNIRVGAEYNIYDFKIRAGVASMGSVYKNIPGNSQNNMIYSAGFGYYSQDGWFFNMTTVFGSLKNNYTPYVLESTPRDYYSATNKFNLTGIMFSIGTRFE